MVMKTFDDNWLKLKEEDRTLPEKQPHSMNDADDIKLVYWFNNPKQQKISWRERMSPMTAWVDLGDTKGMWRPEENRLYEEIQAEYAINKFGKGYRVIKSTARSINGENMLNLKLLQVECHGEVESVMLIANGNRVFLGKKYKVNGGQGWKFRDSVLLKDLV
jgi:hypothetical protein